MKLWFEGCNVNARDALPFGQHHAGRHRRATSAIIDLAVTERRGDSAAKD
jgi:hypothetical protein